MTTSPRREERTLVAWRRRCEWLARRSSAGSAHSRRPDPMRVLAIDHGSARAGCAISDPTGTIARPLGVIEPPDPRAVAELAAEHRGGARDRRAAGLPERGRGTAGDRGAGVPRRPRRDPRPTRGDLRRAIDHAAWRSARPAPGRAPRRMRSPPLTCWSHTSTRTPALRDEVAGRMTDDRGRRAPGSASAAGSSARLAGGSAGERAARGPGGAGRSSQGLRSSAALRRPGSNPRRRLPPTPLEPGHARRAPHGAASTRAGGCSPWGPGGRGRARGRGRGGDPPVHERRRGRRSQPRPSPPRRSRSPRAMTAARSPRSPSRSACAGTT